MLERNINEIREKIEKACADCGRSSSEIELVGVTKTVEAERVAESVRLGISHIGENRVQEFMSKYDVLKDSGVKFSIIGHLQTNKVKYIADKVHMIQSLDSEKLAAEINRHCIIHGRTMDCLVEINIGEEESKSGIDSAKVTEFIHSLSEFSNIRIKGIMAIPPYCEEVKEQIKYFEKLYQIYIDIGAKKIDNISMGILSMGMSSDFETAIKCGSNMVRVGTSIYGNR